MALTPKQARFVEEFLVSLNATQAATKAGYSANSAAVEGSRLLSNAKIQAALTERRAQVVEATGISPERVLAELGRIGFSDMRKFATWGSAGVSLLDCATLGDDAARCVSEVSETTSKDGGSIKFKLHDKVGALTLIGKHLGMFVDKVEHSGKDGGPIQVWQFGKRKVAF